MTDEEEIEIEKQAEKYRKENYDFRSDPLKALCEQSWIDGVKFGMEHAIEWHDLRKDPKDLPKEDGRYWGFYDYGLRYREIFWSDNQFDMTGVIAWCELPQFKE